MVRARLEQLGESDRVTKWYIRASLATPAAGNRPLRRLTPPSPWTWQPTAKTVDGCRAVADRLLALSVRGHDDASWIGLTRQNGRNVAPGPLGADLYDGLPGVALFLAYLGQVTQEPRYRTREKRVDGAPS